MTYNTTPRRRFSKKQRAAFFLAHHGICYWCGKRIELSQHWAIEHMVPRELMPDASADLDDNLGLIHAHPMECHKVKTRRDIEMISKSNRIVRENGPAEDRKKPKTTIRSRRTTNWPKRPFPRGRGFG